jgi:hypothetical protein
VDYRLLGLKNHKVLVGRGFLSLGMEYEITEVVEYIPAKPSSLRDLK